ncbi:MAG: citryl-CoA lyase [Alicyclobacillus sp.]|nr:citryl-CoA lyase [Alicyclobacillus sp.]
MKLVSDMARVTEDAIFVRGRNLVTELMGTASLSDMFWLEIRGNLPTPEQREMLDALLVTLVEHGHTPNTIAARETYLGAPEALQAAVAAGLLGAGSVFLGSMEGAAQLLQTALQNRRADEAVQALARRVVQELRANRQVIPGLGHPLHKAGDPRALRLFEIAERTRQAGLHMALMREMETAFFELTGKRLPVNATGAIAAIASDMGFDWRIIRGFGLVARVVGLVGHIYEEMHQPIARIIWEEVERATQPGG